MRVLRTLMPRKARHPVSYKLKRACGAIKSFKSFLIEFSINNSTNLSKVKQTQSNMRNNSSQISPFCASLHFHRIQLYMV